MDVLTNVHECSRLYHSSSCFYILKGQKLHISHLCILQFGQYSHFYIVNTLAYAVSASNTLDQLGLDPGS